MVTQQNTIIWLLDSDAVENNKHRTLSFPISVGFKRTPCDTKSYCKPPGQTLFVYVGLTYKYIRHRRRKIFNLGGGLKQLRAKRADRALARGFHGVRRGWPPGGCCKVKAPPCLRKYSIRACVFGGTINSQFSPFLSKVIYDFGGCKRAAPPFPEKFLYLVS